MSKTIKSKQELTSLPAYELVMEESLQELNSLGLVFRHKKSGARVIVVSNDDNNKVFSIGFRTPPSNSTGVPHIIEHTVLCGSTQFPAKDPFVELVKGSLNTFLNAMTYSDKTIYPIASCNDKDFQNLMHVYLDAVFYPNIYKKEEIFKQEGWHYELESLEGELTYNGVVYNEMKGVFSSPEQQLYRLIQQSLFPETTYGVESGGDPEVIPELSYEEFLDFHRKYYHPSNSYIYLYGDMDIEEKLNFMDEQYLSKFELEEVDSVIPKQKAFDDVKVVEAYYSLAENEEETDKSYLSYNTVIGTSLDTELYLAFQIIEYVLLSAPGAPLKQVLLDKKLGKDIMGSFDNGLLQPYFSIIAKNTEAKKVEEFLQVIRTTLEEITQKGIDVRALQAAINYYEFKYKEADFGAYPKGLMYGIQILDSWLYDDEKPFIHIEAGKTFEFLKNQIGTGYYEKLIKEYLIHNTHASLVVVKPKVGLTKEMEEATKKKLANYKATLTNDQLQQIIDQTKALKEYQDEPSTKEELEMIPLLSREDIDKKARQLKNELGEVDGIKTIHHNVFTNEIAYVKLLFDVGDVQEELVPYMSLLSTVLGYIDTSKHSFLEFSNEVNIFTGGISSDVNLYAKAGVPNQSVRKFEIKTKVLYENMEKAFELMKEMLFETKLDDEKRLKEIVQELISRLEMKMNSSGHVFAVNRAMSYFSQNSCFNDLTGGIAYYEFLKELEANYEERKDTLIAKLSEVLHEIIRKDNLMVSITADKQGYQLMEQEIRTLNKDLIEKTEQNAPSALTTQVRNEGIKTSSKVQYVARAGNFIEAGYSYTGALRILKVILSYDYLWLNVRVKGGAYGCMSGFSMDGNGYFASYRDPNLTETNEVYEKTAEYLRNFTVDERDMTKYIIGTISSMDTPLTPQGQGSRSLSAYLSGVTQEQLQKEREQVLSAGVEEIRALADLVDAIVKQGYICVIGNEDKIVEAKELFSNVVTI